MRQEGISMVKAAAESSCPCPWLPSDDHHDCPRAGTPAVWGAAPAGVALTCGVHGRGCAMWGRRCCWRWCCRGLGSPRGGARARGRRRADRWRCTQSQWVARATGRVRVVVRLASGRWQHAQLCTNSLLMDWEGAAAGDGDTEPPRLATPTLTWLALPPPRQRCAEVPSCSTA